MTRQQILEAAAQIFREKGFHAASMQEIADAVCLRKASLYHHFSSKQEILVEILALAMDLLIERLTDITTQDASPEAKLREAIHCYADVLTGERDLAAVLLLEFRSVSGPFRDRHIPRRDHFEKLWRDLIQDGITQGVFAPVEPSLAVKMVVGSLNWMITWYRPDGPMSAEEIAGRFAATYINGLLARNHQNP